MPICTAAVDWQALTAAAADAATHASAAYSKFRVGAAGVDTNGRIFTGCNVENASYLALHAEWNLVGAATLADATLVAMVCVVADDSAGPSVAAPCGICRQVLYEHGGPDLLVLCAGGPQRLRRLYPQAFTATAMAG